MDDLKTFTPEPSEDVQKHHKFILKCHYLHAKLLALAMEF